MGATMVSNLAIIPSLLPLETGVWQTLTLVQSYAMFVQLGFFNGLAREYPYLMGQDKPDLADPEALFRTTSPMLFVQGERDRRCDGAALRKALRRVGAPMERYDVAEADSNFRVPRRSTRTHEEIHAEVFGVLANWMARRLRA